MNRRRRVRSRSATAGRLRDGSGLAAAAFELLARAAWAGLVAADLAPAQRLGGARGWPDGAQGGAFRQKREGAREGGGTLVEPFVDVRRRLERRVLARVDEAGERLDDDPGSLVGNECAPLRRG